MKDLRRIFQNSCESCNLEITEEQLNVFMDCTTKNLTVKVDNLEAVGTVTGGLASGWRKPGPGRPSRWARTSLAAMCSIGGC
jgi:hypothetical protein